MLRRELNPENPVITGLFAHYCGPWQYDKVRKLFDEQGYEFHTPDVPTSDPDASLDDLAFIYRAFQQELCAREIVELGHSFSGDLLYRKLGFLPVTLQVYMGTPLRPVLENLGFKVEKIGLGLRYGAYVSAEEDGLTEFERDRGLLGDSLFGDLPTPVKDWATPQLRPHPHKSKHITQNTEMPKTSEGGPELVDPNLVLPNGVEKIFVNFINDKVWQNYFQIQTANRLALERVQMSTTHFPMLEKPEYFVKKIIEIIESKKKIRQKILLGKKALALSLQT